MKLSAQDRMMSLKHSLFSFPYMLNKNMKPPLKINCLSLRVAHFKKLLSTRSIQEKCNKLPLCVLVNFIHNISGLCICTSDMLEFELLWVGCVTVTVVFCENAMLCNCFYCHCIEGIIVLYLREVPKITP